jgi:hypothetical protein
MLLKVFVQVTGGVLENREIVYSTHDEDNALDRDTTRDFTQWVTQNLTSLQQLPPSSPFGSSSQEVSRLTETETSLLQTILTHLLLNIETSVPNHVLALHILSTSLESNYNSPALW